MSEHGTCFQFDSVGTMRPQAWHAWAVMNFEAVLHYKHQNQGRDEKKKLRHGSGASANSEASNSDSEADSTDHSPSPGQKKVNEVRVAEAATFFSHSRLTFPIPLGQIFNTDDAADATLSLCDNSPPCVMFPQDLSKTLLLYTVPAVQGFFRSISLSRGNNLQDTLRLIHLP